MLIKDLYRFIKGGKARASEVNHNFDRLVESNNDLEKRVQELETVVKQLLEA